MTHRISAPVAFAASSTLATACALTLALLAPPAHAVTYQAVQADKSSVTFAYKQMGVGMSGKFRKFAAQLQFDPARPEQAKANVEIDLGSVDAGSKDADQELAGKSWFNTGAFPKASFASRQIRLVSPGEYEVTGTLTIKGQARDVKFPLKLTAQGQQAVFAGGFTVKRGDFAIGEGMWSKFDVVANDVQVNFQLTALVGK